MPPAVIGGAIAGVGALGAAAISSSASKSAAETQAQAAENASAVQKQIFEEQKALQEPYRQAGLTGQNQLLNYLGLGADTSAAGYGQWASPTLTADQFSKYQDPGYSFRLDQGLKALQNSAIARGGLLSGNAMRGITDYSQGLASEEYQNAFNRYQTSRAAALSPLQQLQGIGQAAASNQGAAAGSYGQSVGNLMTGSAAAQAAGTIGSAQSYSNALGNIAQSAYAYPAQQAQSNYYSSLANSLNNSNSQVYMPTTLSGQAWKTNY